MKRKRYSFKKDSIKTNKEPLKPLFKHQLLITCISIFFVVIATLATSFAIFSKTANGNEYNVVQVGELELSYVDLNDEGNVLQLNNEFPVSDETGSTGTAYRFSVENTGTLVAKYTVKIIDDTDTIDADGCSDNLIDPAYIRYKFDNGEIGTLSDIATDDGTGYIIHEGSLQPFESNIHEIRLWLSATSPNSVLGAHYHGKVIIELEQGSGSDPYERPVNPNAVTIKAFASENLGNNCATYDDGTDTFLVGQCSQNYVWYSGKLWRVVLKNNQTGTVKMVTDNTITAIAYNASGNAAFQDSYIDQWLKQEFLPTLHDYEDYLEMDSIWNDTRGNNNARPSETTTVQRTVGLLNSYEYYATYTNSNSLATSSTTYLNNKTYWWSIGPASLSSVWCVDNNGAPTYYTPANGYGVRPAVNVRADIQVSSGSGSKSDPYILKGDIQETTNGTTLLSTRYSGEYVTFNNELYRIVDKETINGETLTKITAVNELNGLSSEIFDNSVMSFADASIKTELETYYQDLKSSNQKAYDMIKMNTTWYFGKMGTGINYKASICATVDDSISMNECTTKASSTTANIGLPRPGEMFTSQIIRDVKNSFWALTSSDLGGVGIINNYGYLHYVSPSATTVSVRPSMYLKSTVKIASDNTGNGTYEKPYEIEYLITFKIVDTENSGNIYTFQAPSGWTWADFIDSKYDNSEEQGLELILSGDYIHVNGFYMQSSSGVLINNTETISEQEYYGGNSELGGAN